MRSFQKGFSLVEILIALGLASVLGMTGYSIYLYSKRNTDRVTDSIQTTISKLGASSILKKDLSAAELSFNYLNLNDDKGFSFFTHAKNQYCRHKDCGRKLTLTIKEGETKSKPIYFIVRKSILNEIQKLTIHPKSVFDGNNYAGINWRHTSSDYSLSPEFNSESSWIENRIMLISSENDFFDCNLSTKFNNASTCRIECSDPGSCDFAIKRPYRFLGVVAPKPSADMNLIEIENSPNLLLRKYNICRPNKNNNCAGYISTNLNSTRNLYEKLPYTPGADDRTSIYYVEVVKYYLEKRDNQTVLMRSLGAFENGRISFNHSINIMSGISSIIFSRVNISNPVIEYQFISNNNHRFSNL